MLELAARSIGGLCSRALRFDGGQSLEELVLANALGRRVSAVSPNPRPCGVLMLPVERSGVLRAVEGRAEAAAVPGITGLTITTPIGRPVVPCQKETGTWASSSPRLPGPTRSIRLTTASQRLQAIIE